MSKWTKKIVAVMLAAMMLLGTATMALASRGEIVDGFGENTVLEQGTTFTVTETLRSAMFDNEANRVALMSDYGVDIDKLNVDDDQNARTPQEYEEIEQLKKASVLDMIVSVGEKNEDGTANCTAKGSLSINGKVQQYEVSGRVYQLSNTICIGGLTGFYGDAQTPDNVIDLSLHYKAATNEAIVLASIGAIQEDKTPITVEYGNTFDGLNDAVAELNSIRETNQNKSEVVESEIREAQGAMDVERRASVSGSYNGYTVVNGTMYCNTQAWQTGNFETLMQLQANTSAFANAANRYLHYNPNAGPYSVYTTIGHMVDEVGFICETSTNYGSVTNHSYYPLNANNKINIRIPYLPQPWSTIITYFDLSISYSGASTSRSNGGKYLYTRTWGNLDSQANGSGITQHAYWNNQISSGRSGNLYWWGFITYYYNPVQQNGYTLSQWQTCSTYASNISLSSR